MSKKSGNSKAGSEGDVDSIFSSYNNSPRNKPDLVSAGPFGDSISESTTQSQTNCVIFMMNHEESSEASDDQDICDLKSEYLERLRMIREKLQSIDIANYDSYYNKYYGSPKGCQITEIPQNSDEYEEKVENTDIVKENESVEQDETVKGNAKFCSDTAINRINIIPSSSKPNKEDLASPLANNEHPSHTASTAITNIDQKLETKTSENFELKTIFTYENPYNIELDTSSTEVIDLNYNPPKKRPCFRESTPKIHTISSEGAMSLPYHIRVSLHKDLLLPGNVEDQLGIEELKDKEVIENIVEKKEDVDDKSDGYDADASQDRGDNNHIFPEVTVDLHKDENLIESSNKSSGKTCIVEQDSEKGCVSSRSPRKIYQKYQEEFVLCFDSIEQSPGNSSRSYKTIITETTVTESPPRKPKRRRLLLRSARNKVKPTDRMTLWEEIRTMTALKQQKTRSDSSHSRESFFKNVIIKEEHETEVNIVSIGSLDIPPKKTLSIRFPSITKITSLCSSLFSRKSKTIMEETDTRKNNGKKKDTKKGLKKRHVTNMQPTVNVLKDYHKDQKLNYEEYHLSPSCSEEQSEYSYYEDDDYYDDIFCPCFCV